MEFKPWGYKDDREVRVAVPRDGDGSPARKGRQPPASSTVPRVGHGPHSCEGAGKPAPSWLD